MKDRVVFIDTGFWIALFDSCDQHHAKAAESWSTFQNEHKLVTSAFILYETITYLNCSLKNHRLALQFLDALDTSGISVLTVDPTICSDALALFRQSPASRFSFTDCTSFALMHQENIAVCAGFDLHFSHQGFSLTPSPSARR